MRSTENRREGNYEICYKNDARVSKLDEHDAVYRKNAQGRPRPRDAGHASVVGGITASRSIAGERCARFRERMRKGLREKKTVEGGGGGGEEQLANWQLLRSWRLTISLWMACNTSGFLSL